MKNFYLRIFTFITALIPLISQAQSNGYCPAYLDGACEAIITNVQFSNINRGSTCDFIDGYDDYVPFDTAYIATVDAQVLTVTVDPGANLLYTEQVTAWIDWNGNKIYDYILEPDELYSLSGNTAAGVYTTVITVPPTAVVDSTILLRIVDGFFLPNFTDFCDSLIVAYEIEDYAVVVTDNPPASGGGTTYCPATGSPTCSNGTNTNFIENVAITGELGSAIDNTTACDAGYGDFTAQSVVLSQGLVYTLSVLENNPDQTIFGTVNIDWNQDGVFDLAEEIDMASAPAGANSVLVSVPVDAVLGATRMRIVIENGTGDLAVGACDSPVSGEVEDYTVIVSALTANAPECPNKLSPANNDTTVCLSSSLIWNTVDGADKYHYFLYKADGTTVLQDSTNTGMDTTITLPALDTNTTYYWTVLAQVDGDVSLSCQTFQFRTVPYLGPTNTFNIANPFFQCALDSVDIIATTIDATGPFTYSWVGTDADSLNRVDTNEVYFSSASPGDFELILNTTDANGCGTIDTLAISFVNAADKGVLSIADTSNCFGDSSLISIAGLVGTAQWQVTIDTSGVPVWTDTTLASPNLNEFYTLVTADTLFYRYIADAGGCNDTSSAFQILSLPLPADPIISQVGNDTICAGETLFLVVDNYSTGLLWDDALATTSDTLNVQESGVYTVVYTDTEGCVSSSTSDTLQINALPAKPTILTDNSLPACVGETVVLTTNADPANTLLWSDGTTNDTLLVTVSDTILLTVTTPEMCSSTSDSLDVQFVMSSPKPTLTIVASAPICEGDVVTIISSDDGNILWNDGTTTNDTLLVTMNGDYFVVTNPGTVCATNSDTVSINFKAIPAQPVITAPNGTTVCTGEPLLLVSSYATNIVWDDALSTTADTLLVTASGAYTVTFTEPAGCSSTSDTTFVSIEAGPAKPVVTQIGDTLYVSSTGATFFQWVGPNGVISGANASFYVPSEKGNYYAIAYSSNGCGSSPSNGVFFSGTGLTENESVNVVFYPNPASDVLNIAFEGNFEVKILSLDGKTLMEQVNNVNTAKLNLEFSAGLYILQISSDTHTVSKPFVIK